MLVTCLLVGFFRLVSTSHVVFSSYNGRSAYVCVVLTAASFIKTGLSMSRTCFSQAYVIHSLFFARRSPFKFQCGLWSCISATPGATIDHICRDKKRKIVKLRDKLCAI